jgi:hypothetical protein
MHRNEPRIYTGKIRMLFGPFVGELVPHDYPVAQSLVASGHAQWEDDPTPLSRHLQTIVNEKHRAREQQIADDAAHSEAKRAAALGPKIEAPKDVNAIHFAMENDVVYLARPAPTVIEVAPEVLGMKKGAYGITAQEGGAIVIKVANATLTYRKRDDVSVDGFIVAEKVETDEPDIELPEDWQKAHFLQQVGFAKRIRRLEPKSKMKAERAYEIIDEWAKGTGYDTRPVPASSEEPAADAGTGDTKGLREVRTVDGKTVVEKSGEEIAADQLQRLDEEDGA